MQTSIMTRVSDHLRQFYLELGFDEIVGIETIDKGIKEFQRGLLPLAGELLQQESQQIWLDDAVYNPQTYPHTTKAHGWLRDLILMDVPDELIPLTRKVISFGPNFGSEHLHHSLASLAFRSRNDFERVLCKFFLFETMCTSQRLDLVRSGTALEALGGKRSDVESIAAQEVELAEAVPDYQEGLLSLDDPLSLLNAWVGFELDYHVECLKEELRWFKREFMEVIDRRRLLLELMEKVPPSDAVLIRNKGAEIFGDERFTPEQLKRVHPQLLGNVSKDAINKRVSRLPDRVAPYINGEKKRNLIVADLMIETMKGE